MFKFFILTSLFLILYSFPLPTQAAFGDTTTYAGKLISGDGSFRTDAYFDFPEDILSDGAGNFYIADTFNGVVRKIDSSGIVSTVVGAGGYGDTVGSASQTKFGHPAAIARDTSGNLYIADAGNGKIKKFSNGTTTTIASDLNRPEGLMVRGTKLYVTDYAADKFISMNLDGSSQRTITSSLNGPKKFYVRTSGDYAYIANSLDYTLVRVELSSGSQTIIAGQKGSSGKNNSTCLSSGFENLWGLTVVEGDSLSADDIYVTDGTGDPGNTYDRDLPIQNTGDAGKIRLVDQNDSTGSTGTCTIYLEFKDSFEFAFNYPTSLTRYGDYLFIAATGTSEIVR
jgi:hypothetical protein